MRARSFGRPISLGQQCRSAGVHEIPADADQHQRNDEVRNGNAGECDRSRTRHQHETGEDHVEHTEALDQRAGEKSGGEHADDVPFDNERGGGERMAANLHRDGRRGHQQIHQSIAEPSGQRCDDEHRLTHDGRQWPTGLAVLLARRLGNAHARLHGHRDESVGREQQEGAEERRREPVARKPCRFRPKKASDDTAGENERNRLRLVGLRRNFRCGKPILQPDRVVNADDRRREAIERKTVRPQCGCAKRTTGDIDHGSGHEAGATPDLSHPQRQRERRDRRPEDVGRDAQCRQRLAVGQRVTDEAVHRDKSRRIDEQQRLAAGQQKDIAVGSRRAHVNAGKRGARRRHARRPYDKAMPLDPIAREILMFWFGDPPLVERAVWFRKDPAFDATIRDRFGATIAAARAGAFGEWCHDPRGALARVVVLDQFTRNVYRGTPDAFSGDERALATADDAIARGFDQRLEPYERWFLYMPFVHSEDRAMQDRAVALFTALAAETGLDSPLPWTQRHAEVIRRFGRFPHRNAILGRASTPEEIEYLATPGSTF